MAGVADAPDYLSLLSLKGRGFVVLGAGQGIGEQSAHALAQAGAKVFCVDSDDERARAIARAVNGHACVADVTKRDDMARIFKEARGALGAVQGVVDIVGVARLKVLADFSDEDWDWQFGIILRHAFLTVQYGAAAVAGAGGSSLTFVGSLAGTRSVRKQVAYAQRKPPCIISCAARRRSLPRSTSVSTPLRPASSAHRGLSKCFRASSGARSKVISPWAEQQDPMRSLDPFCFWLRT